MSIEATREVITAYVAALLARGHFADYFTEDVTFTVIGTGQVVQGRIPVEQFIRFMHEQAFNARAVIKESFFNEGHSAIEFVFVGTHQGEFNGVPATGRSVSVPYVATYDLANGKITAVRLYISMEMLMEQISPRPVLAGAGV